MRILHVIESLDFGGAEKVVVSLANGLADSHDVSICCIKRIGELRDELDCRIKVFCMDKAEGNDYLLPFRLARFLRRQRYDLVQTHNWAVFLEGGLAAVLAGTRRLVHTVHGPYPDYADRRIAQLKLMLRHFLERALARRCLRVVAVSDALHRYITADIGIPADRILTIHNGILEIPWSGATRQTGETVTFMTVGRLAPIKNHAMMLRAFAQVANARPGVRLVVVGDGPERARIEGIIRELRLQETVVLAGFRKEVAPCLREADVFLLTSRYEGISIALLESMQAGLPSICTAVGGMPETVLSGRTGLLVPSDDEDQLAQAMMRLVDSRSLREQMGRDSRAFFQREYSLSTMLGHYQELYAMPDDGSQLA